MNNYPTPMNTLGAFAIVYFAGLATASVFKWLVKQKKAITQTE